MKVEVAVFDSPSLIVLMVSMDVKQTLSSTRTRTRKLQIIWREGRAEQEHSLSKAKLNRNERDHRARPQELCESRGGRPGLPVPNKTTVSVDVKQHLTNHRVPDG